MDVIACAGLLAISLRGAPAPQLVPEPGAPANPDGSAERSGDAAAPAEPEDSAEPQAPAEAPEPEAPEPEAPEPEAGAAPSGPPTEATEPTAASPSGAEPATDTLAQAESAPAESAPAEFAAAPATYDKRPPTEARRKAEAAYGGEDPGRRGGFISLSVGAGHCGVWCSYMGAIGGGRFEAGYRWGHFALGGSVSLYGGNYSLSESGDDAIYSTPEADGSTRFFKLGPMAQLFFAEQGRFDPFLAVGLGFRRLVEVTEYAPNGIEGRYWEFGAGLSVGGGVPVRVSDRVWVGARFDKTFALRGQQCLTVDGQAPDNRDECEPHGQNTSDLNRIDRRFVRLSRPRPWTVSLEVRIDF